MRWQLIMILLLLVLFHGCAQKDAVARNNTTIHGNSTNQNTTAIENNSAYPLVSRAGVIPSNAQKIAPQDDNYPPILHSDDWQTPVPLEGPVNTAGAEDSPFITPDGNEFYFFFTPDVSVPPEMQLFDNVTGIWHTKKINGIWSEPARVWLIEPGKLALDGCEFIQDDTMWFCSAREGYSGINLFTARRISGKWQDVSYVGDMLMKDYETGEMHLSANGNELYFHSGRDGGKGGLDIWVSQMKGEEWQTPVNIDAANSADNEGWPYLTSDGNELWFTRFYQGSPAIFRSLWVNGTWGEPKMIISRFAGEPTLDDEGNIYFTHHFYNNSKMIEADIYVAKRK